MSAFFPRMALPALGISSGILGLGALVVLALLVGFEYDTETVDTLGAIGLTMMFSSLIGTFFFVSISKEKQADRHR